jgi:excisionase family DNA binding protein
MVNEKHLTIDDLADRCGVPRMTVERWNSRGGGPAFMKIGRHVRYRLQDVIAWEESRIVIPEDTPAPRPRARTSVA